MPELKRPALPSALAALAPIVKKFERSWDEAEGFATCKLLRLALLRDSSRAIHALRSEAMAKGKDKLVVELARKEEWLNSVMGALELPRLALSEILDSDERALKSATPSQELPTALPRALTEALHPSELSRHDRKWELFLAHEALSAGWGFWRLSASIDVARVEAFAQALNQGAWPSGIALFAESSGISGEKWRGNWTWILEKNPPHFDFSNFPNAAPEWRKLYPNAPG